MAGEVENIAISTQVEVELKLELKSELSLAIGGPRLVRCITE